MPKHIVLSSYVLLVQNLKCVWVCVSSYFFGTCEFVLYEGVSILGLFSISDTWLVTRISENGWPDDILCRRGCCSQAILSARGLQKWKGGWVTGCTCPSEFLSAPTLTYLWLGYSRDFHLLYEYNLSCFLWNYFPKMF